MARALALLKVTLSRPDLDCITEAPFCQTCFVARWLPAKRVELVGQYPRGGHGSEPKAAKRLPPCHCASFCDARQTIAVRARYTFINLLRSRHVSKHARENNLHTITLSPILTRSPSLSRSLSLATAWLSHVSRYTRENNMQGYLEYKHPQPSIGMP